MKSRGFTLIELMIALVIFSVVSIGALAGLNQMIRAKEQHAGHQDYRQNLMRSYAEIYQDIKHVTAKPLNPRGESVVFNGDSIHFTRTPGMQEIYYHVEGSNLYRSYFQGDEMITVPLLENVDDLRILWGGKDQPMLMITFKDHIMGNIKWTFTAPHI